MQNTIFTHSTLNDNTPCVFRDYFKFKDSHHQHETINNTNSIYSIPKGSLELPARFNSAKKSIKYICCKDWNSILKELSNKFKEKYLSNENWLISLKVSTLKHLLKCHFLGQYWTITNMIIFSIIFLIFCLKQ